MEMRFWGRGKGRAQNVPDIMFGGRCPVNLQLFAAERRVGVDDNLEGLLTMNLYYTHNHFAAYCTRSHFATTTGSKRTHVPMRSGTATRVHGNSLIPKTSNTKT